MMPENKTGPVLTMVTYRPKPGLEDELRKLVESHWPTIHRLGLATDTPARVWKTTDREGKVAFVELFAWKDAQASGAAHRTPEVMALWEPMGKVLESIAIAQAEALA